MSEVFEKQSLLLISCDTHYGSLGSADAGTTKILYSKPDGTAGEWTGSVNGTKIEYNVQNGDIDQKGNWIFQAYFEVSGLKSYGKKATKYFDKPLL